MLNNVIYGKRTTFASIRYQNLALPNGSMFPCDTWNPKHTARASKNQTSTPNHKRSCGTPPALSFYAPAPRPCPRRPRFRPRVPGSASTPRRARALPRQHSCPRCCPGSPAAAAAAAAACTPQALPIPCAPRVPDLLRGNLSSRTCAPRGRFGSAPRRKRRDLPCTGSLLGRAGSRSLRG